MSYISVDSGDGSLKGSELLQQVMKMKDRAEVYHALQVTAVLCLWEEATTDGCRTGSGLGSYWRQHCLQMARHRPLCHHIHLLTPDLRTCLLPS